MTMRIGLVGCGFIANLHSWSLWALRKADLFDLRITAVCDADTAKAGAMAERLRADVLDVETLLGSVDVVYVCTPTSSHLDLVRAAADRGLPVFCEKPLAPDLGSASLVAEQLERVPHQVGLVMRTAPVFRTARELIASGRYGRPMTIHLRDDQYFPIQGQYGSTWRADVSVAGGGTLIEHSIHDVDIFRFLCGGDAASVTCSTANFFGHPGVEDLAVASFTWPDGLVANLVSVWHQITSRPSTRRVEIFCEDAMLWLEEAYTGPLHVQSSDGDETIECAPPGWVDEIPVPEEFRRPLGEYANASLGFLEAVRDGAAPSGPNAADALAAHRLVDAAYRSAAQGGSAVPIG